MEFPTLIGTDGGDGFLWWMLLGVLVPFLLGEGKGSFSTLIPQLETLDLCRILEPFFSH